MKVGLVTQHYAPDFEGGTEAVVRAQARALVASGCDVTIVAGTDREDAEADVIECVVDGITVRFVPRLDDEPYDLLLDRPRIEVLVRDLLADRDLIHVHHHSTLHGQLVASLARDDRPVFLTLHDLFVTCPRWFRIPPDAEIVCGELGEFDPCVRCVKPDAAGIPDDVLQGGLTERFTRYRNELECAARVFVPSRTHGERLAALTGYDFERLRIAPNGLIHQVKRIVKRGWNPESGPLRALFVGHLAQVKGVDDIVQAIELLEPDVRANVELHLLGSEVDEALSQRLEGANLGLVRHGGFEGHEFQSRVEQIEPHLALLPSRAHESYGLTLDECLGLGLPAWVSDRGALKERVEDGGRILPAEDPEAWSRALAEVIADPEILERERRAVPRVVPGPEVGAEILLAEYHAALQPTS